MSLVKAAAAAALAKRADWRLPVNALDVGIGRALDLDSSPVRSGYAGGRTYEQARDADFMDQLGDGAGVLWRGVTIPGRWLADRMNGVPTSSQRATQMADRQRLFDPDNPDSPLNRTEALMPGARDAAMARADAESPLARPGARRSRAVPASDRQVMQVAGLRPASGNVAMYGERGSAIAGRLPRPQSQGPALAGGEAYGPPVTGLKPIVGMGTAIASRPTKPPAAQPIASTFAKQQNRVGVKRACEEYFAKRASVGGAIWEGLKFVPVVGAVPSAIDAVGHAADGNFGRAGLEAGMGALSLFPGVGQAGRLAAAGGRLAGAGRLAFNGARAVNAGALRAAGTSAMGAAGQLGRALGVRGVGRGLASAGRNAARGNWRGVGRGLNRAGANLFNRTLGETALTAPLAFRNARGLGGLAARLFTSPATLGSVGMGLMTQ